MRKKYLTDYMLDNKLKIEFNKVNTINAPCGSGKTTFIFSKKGVIYNLNKFIESENVNFKNVLYVTDTSMLKDKVLNKYNNITKQIRTKDFFSDISKPGITVVTYAQLGSILSNPDFKEVLLNHYNLIIF
ncbi:DEAD/DEAH box helicase family protein, partial [Clostridium perfringens]